MLKPLTKKLLILGTLLGCTVVSAQNQVGAGMPEALKDIKPASGVCRRDAPEQTSNTAQTSSMAWAPDLSCALDGSELARMLGQPGVVVVDTRTSQSFNAFRIADALNLDVANLRQKTFLYDKTVILAGSGKGERELYSACAALKAQGFKRVSVLRGGMAAWAAQGLPALGRASDAGLMEGLSSAELWVESQFDANLLLIVRERVDMLSQLKSGVEIVSASPEALSSMLARYRKANRNALPAALLLVAAAPLPAEDLQKLRQAIKPVPLLMYADKTEAYVRYLKQQQAVWAAQALGPKQLGCGL
ncbi:MAG: hypothetical protein H6R19_2088 [Proteobacteria bacterium]|nr:hypothetical protein [Pseudomonadota bacterium]